MHRPGCYSACCGPQPLPFTALAGADVLPLPPPAVGGNDPLLRSIAGLTERPGVRLFVAEGGGGAEALIGCHHADDVLFVFGARTREEARGRGLGARLLVSGWLRVGGWAAGAGYRTWLVCVAAGPRPLPCTRTTLPASLPVRNQPDARARLPRRRTPSSTAAACRAWAGRCPPPLSSTRPCAACLTRCGAGGGVWLAGGSAPAPPLQLSCRPRLCPACGERWRLQPVADVCRRWR